MVPRRSRRRDPGPRQVVAWNCRVCKKYPFEVVSYVHDSKLDVAGVVGHIGVTAFVAFRGTTTQQACCGRARVDAFDLI